MTLPERERELGELDGAARAAIEGALRSGDSGAAMSATSAPRHDATRRTACARS